MINIPMNLATKSVTQKIDCMSHSLHDLMEHFRSMVNQTIRIGIENECHTRISLTKLAYHKIPDDGYATSYKLCAISQAAGRLAQMRKSINRGIKTRTPYVRKPYITNSYGFKINGYLLTIPHKPREPINILLNEHTAALLSDQALKVRSFTITPQRISICVSKEVNEIQCDKTVGIDRNLRNITCGNDTKVTFYKTAKLLSISQNTSRVISALKRNDCRIRRNLVSKLDKRRHNRTRQILHQISKDIVQNAAKEKKMIVFENLKRIRKLYRKGNGQGKRHRQKMNGGWPLYELQRQIEYKAALEGIPVKFVNPRCTSKFCPVCGKRTRMDRHNRRKLLCTNCGRSMDRDVVASMNIAHKGWLWHIHPGGKTNEAMVQEPGDFFLQPVILQVDVLKLVCR